MVRQKKYFIVAKRTFQTQEQDQMNTILSGISNWRTTLTAIIGAIAYIVAAFGIQVTPEVQTSLVVVILFFIGLFAKDGSNTPAR